MLTIFGVDLSVGFIKACKIAKDKGNNSNITNNNVSNKTNNMNISRNYNKNRWGDINFKILLADYTDSILLRVTLKK